MSVVVDANLLVVLATRDPRSAYVEPRLQAWLDAGEELHAPALLPYEVANALTRLVAAGRMTVEDANEAWVLIGSIPVRLHSMESGHDVLGIALRLRRQSAYDAAYVALAQQLGAELWTLDGPLARNAAGLALPVRLIE